MSLSLDLGRPRSSFVVVCWAEDATTLLHDMYLRAAAPCAAIASGAMFCWLSLACGMHVCAVHLEAPYSAKHAKVLRRRLAFILASCAGLEDHSRAGCGFASSGWQCSSVVACVQILGLVPASWNRASGALPCGRSLVGSLGVAFCTPRLECAQCLRGCVFMVACAGSRVSH